MSGKSKLHIEREDLKQNFDITQSSRFKFEKIPLKKNEEPKYRFVDTIKDETLEKNYDQLC